MAAGETALRQTLRDLLERWDAADRKAWQAQATQQGADLAQAQQDRYEAETEVWCLQAELGDLLLLLLRCCLNRDEDRLALRARLLDLLALDIARIVRTALAERNGHG
jgi:hypothetical protein